MSRRNEKFIAEFFFEIHRNGPRVQIRIHISQLNFRRNHKIIFAANLKEI